MATLSVPLCRLSLQQQHHHHSSPSRTSLTCQVTHARALWAPARSFLGQPLVHGPPLSRPFSPVTTRRRSLTLCFAAAVTGKKKKADSAAKRARQSEKARIYNKSRKSEIHTRMKKVFVALENLKKSSEPSVEMIGPIESLVAEAFSTIDKAVKVGTIHRNTGAHRKSRLSRAKKTVEIQLGWYTPSPVT